MNQSIIVKKLYRDELIGNTGYALDLGFGKSQDALELAGHGFILDTVDSDEQVVKTLGDECSKDANKNLKINIYHQKIEDFEIKKEKYDCIIASNSLPFIESKEKVKEIIKNIVSGLKSDGCFYITLFGIKDAWIDKKNMSFWEYDEIKNILDSLDVNFYHNTIEEGYGRTMKGDIKYWNVFKFIYIKR